MSLRLINRSADIKKLRDEGYDVEIRSSYLIVKDVPYVNSKKEVRLGWLVSKLVLANDVAAPPDDHTIFFAGSYPCFEDGVEIEQIRNISARRDLGEGLVVDHQFSAKPKPSGKYEDYHAKITTYVSILSGPAATLDITATAKTFPTIEVGEEESVFKYVDTASSRSEINRMTAKLAKKKLAILGLGGTGSYVMDLVAKTPVKEIHLYDGDRFYQHNAFRSPGAPSGEELQQKVHKALYFQGIYSRMRREIVAHTVNVDISNIDELREMDFAFICIDRSEEKRLIVDKLFEYGVPFIDVGMGVYVADDSLAGILRTTSNASDIHDAARVKGRISMSDGRGADEYVRNIQIADLNALNAALAVIKWKKMCGFYADLDRERHSTYTIDGNVILNDDRL